VGDRAERRHRFATGPQRPPAPRSLGEGAHPQAPVNEDLSLSPQMSDALSQLPASQREAVELIHLQGLSVTEAAARVGISPGALKVRAHRGYRALRARLARPEP
jgi:RNA polymerase sigma-70 factor (ECF subfamily)